MGRASSLYHSDHEIPTMSRVDRLLISHEWIEQYWNVASQVLLWHLPPTPHFFWPWLAFVWLQIPLKFELQLQLNSWGNLKLVSLIIHKGGFNQASSTLRPFHPNLQCDWGLSQVGPAKRNVPKCSAIGSYIHHLLLENRILLVARAMYALSQVFQNVAWIDLEAYVGLSWHKAWASGCCNIRDGNSKETTGLRF